MSEVFVSYSRKDLAFVDQLRGLLEKAGFAVWVDIEGLYAGEEFWPEVGRAIDAASALVFVMTPDSVASRFCNQELDWAVTGKKRIVPLCHREVDAGGLHPELAKRQWVFFRDSDDPGTATDALLSAVRADWVELRQQARLLVRAREWTLKNRDDALVLRGHDLREAEGWLEHSRNKENGATPLHTEFIHASRRAAEERRRRLIGAVGAAFATIAVVAWFGLAKWIASLSNLSLDDMSRGQVGAAIDKLERANRLCSRFGSMFAACQDARLNLGHAYLDAGRHVEAVSQLSRAIDGVPRTEAEAPVAAGFRATAYQDRSYAHVMLAEEQSEERVRQDEYTRAEDDLDAAASIYERLPDGLADRPLGITRARIRIGRGEYAQALVELQRASRMSDAPDIDLLLSATQHCLGRGEQSLQHFKRYIEHLPDRAQSPHWQRNQTYYKRIMRRCTTD